MHPESLRIFEHTLTMFDKHKHMFLWLCPSMPRREPVNATHRQAMIIMQRLQYSAPECLLLLQCRTSCSWRVFQQGNQTELNPGYLYAAEPLLHEVSRAGLIWCMCR